MNRTHEYDDANEPPPPPWWQGPLVTLGFIVALIAAVHFLTSCVCSITCRPDVPAAIEIIETISTK